MDAGDTNRLIAAAVGGCVGIFLFVVGGLTETASPNGSYPLQPIAGFILVAFGAVVLLVAARGATKVGSKVARSVATGSVLVVGLVAAGLGLGEILSSSTYVFADLLWFVQVAVIGFVLALLIYVRSVRTSGGTLQPVEGLTTAAPTSVSPASVPLGSSFCPFDGQPVLAGFKFCRLCGKPVA